MIDRYSAALVAELAPQLAERGLQYSPELSDEECQWFVGPVSAGSDLTKAVVFSISQLKEGHGLFVVADLISTGVAQVVRDLPRAGWISEAPAAGEPDLGRVDFTRFAEHIPAGEYDLYGLHEMAHVAKAAAWIMRCLDGPVSEWFSQRDCLDKLIPLAGHPRPNMVNRPNPSPFARRLRTTVILCVLNGRLTAASDLMGWYLESGRFAKVDSFDRATAFDAALCERFPGYAEARTLTA